METNNSNDAIEFSIKKTLYNQIFKNGNQKCPAIVSHLTVYVATWQMFNCLTYGSIPIILLWIV